MMRPKLALAMCILIHVSLKAASKPFLADTSKVIAAKGHLYLPDSLFIVPLAEDQSFSSSGGEDISYKQRLDSVRKIVPLPYNEYVQNYIDIYLSRRREDFSKVIGLSQYYFPIYEKALKEQDIPEELKYLSIVESALDPYAVSRSGATGLWQFMYTTAKGYGLNMDNYVDERRDPLSASKAAATYFKDSFNQLGDWLLVIASYNCGMGAVTRAIAKAGGQADFWAIRNYLPQETRNYVPAFIATVYVMNYYARHNIIPRSADFPMNTDLLQIDHMVSLAAIAKAVHIDPKYLSILNPAYKKQVINGTRNNPKSLVVPHLDQTSADALYSFLGNVSPAKLPTSEVLLTAITPEIKPDFYKVRPGETLEEIAINFQVEVQDLKVWNNLKTTRIVPGQKLRLAAADNNNADKKPKSVKTYISYKVQPGDTLSTIADKFNGVSVSDLKAANGLRGSVLQPGMILKINKG